MSTGQVALSEQPKTQILINGKETSIRSFQAAANEILKMQLNSTPNGTYNNQRCNGLTPYEVFVWNIIKSDPAAQATGTVTLAAAEAGDTVTVNGLVYTAVAGTKANNTEFSISGTDTVDAADLVDSVNNDTRIGTIGDITATSALGVVTFTSSLLGEAGDVVTLVSSNGTRLAVSGATFSGGGTTYEYDLNAFVSGDTNANSSAIGRPALSQRRLIEITLDPADTGFTFSVRSFLAALNYIQKFEDVVASQGDGAALDGVYTNQPVGGPTPYENYIWDITKSDISYTLNPTTNS